MIKKIKKREEFYHQPIMDGIGNFRLKIIWYSIHLIIKKREKRDKFLNQPVVEGYKDFDILFYNVRSD